MLICESCGAVFEYPASKKDWETGCVDEFCPECHSEYIMRAVACQVCGEWVQEDAVYGYGHAVCENCINEQSYDLDMLAEATKDEYQDMELPILLREFYTDDDIKELLMADLKKRREAGLIGMNDIKRFVKWHMNEVADELVKEGEEA